MDIIRLENITCAFIEMAGMTAENQVRQYREESPAYDEQSFVNLIDKYHLSPETVHNCTACGKPIETEKEWIKSGPLKTETRYYHEECC